MARISEPFDRLAALDKTVHEPARLAILTALSACRHVHFRFLQSVTGLTQGNLSIHLSKLEEKGLIDIEKGFRGRYPSTSVELTDHAAKESRSIGHSSTTRGSPPRSFAQNPLIKCLEAAAWRSGAA